MYVSSKDAERIEDAICELEGQQVKFGYARQKVVEKHIFEYVQKCVDEWEANPTPGEI